MEIVNFSYDRKNMEENEMQGKFGKNTWKVKFIRIAGQLLVLACICAIVAVVVWKARKIQFSMDILSADFLVGILGFILSVLLIIYIVKRNEWSNKRQIIVFGIVGAVISEVSDVVLGARFGSLAWVFVIAAVLAKVGLIAIPLYLELFCILGSGISGIIGSMSKETQEMLAQIIDPEIPLTIIMILPLILIIFKVRIHDR